MEHGKVIRSTFTIGAMTMVSRLLGLIRDVLTAGVFGTSLAFSAFVVAFRIPNLFRELFGEGALASAFVPVFVRTRETEGEPAAWRMARKVTSLAAATLLLIIVVGIGLLTLAGHIPGLDERAATIMALARITLPYMLFICLAALAMALLNAHHRFAVAAAMPSLLNIVWILSVWLIVPGVEGGAGRQIYVLAWAILFSGSLQLLFQLPALWRCGWRPGFDLDIHDQHVRRVLGLMGPAAIGMAVSRVNIMIDGFLAAWIGTWAPAALFYAERLIYLPQGLLATAMSAVLLPVLSSQAARACPADMARTISRSLQTLLFVMIPATVGLFILAPAILQMIFEWGAFTAESTELTTRALRFYAPGLLVFCLPKVFVPAFYALHDTRTPVKISLLCVALNFTLNLIFIFTWPLYWRHAGLACSTVIAEACYGITLGILLRRRIGALDMRGLCRTVTRALACATGMAVAAWGTLHGARILLDATAHTDKTAQIISTLSALLVGIVVYFTLTALLRMPELREVLRAVSRRGGTETAPRADS